MKKLLHLLVILILLPLFGQGQEVLKPNSLSADYNPEKRIIHLSWEASQSKVAGYNLFVKQGKGSSFFLWGKASLISGTKYDYEVVSRDGVSVEFKVCGVQNFPKVVRSDYSNTVLVDVPSLFLPMVKLNKPVVKKKFAEISWGFNSKAADLDGFIIYLDKTEVKASKEARSYVFKELESGTHTVYVVAISKSNLKSAPSPKKFITIK